MPRKPSSRRWYLRPLPIIVSVASLGFAIWFVFGEAGLWDSYKLRRERQQQAELIRKLEFQKQQLSAYYAALKAKDVTALERAAREHGLVAPDEIIYEIHIGPQKP